MDFAVSVALTLKTKQSEKDRQMSGSCKRADKGMEHESDRDTTCNWSTWNDPQRTRKETGESGKKELRPSRPQYCQDKQEYWKESWKGELRILSDNSDYSERLPIKTGAKTNKY